jgi:LysM repeat protein
MSRLLAVLSAFVLTAAAEAAPLPHASGAPAGPGPGCGGSFTAARGDTLYSIARRCETTVTELAQENRLGQPPQLAAGQRLSVPGFDRAGPKPPEAGPPPAHDLLPPHRDRPDRPEPPLVRVRTRVPVAAPSPPPPILRRDDGDIYHFQAGDTLYSLARWARTSLAALRAANPDVDPRGIETGDPIRLPRGAARPEPMRARERGAAMVRPAVQVPVMPLRPPAARPAPPRPPVARPAPPADDADKPKPDDDEDTPGGMDDGRPQPDGM